MSWLDDKPSKREIVMYMSPEGKKKFEEALDKVLKAWLIEKKFGENEK